MQTVTLLDVLLRFLALAWEIAPSLALILVVLAIPGALVVDQVARERSSAGV